MCSTRSRIVSASALGLLLAVGVASAQPAPSCEQERDGLRWLVQHFQAGRTAAELEVARLHALSQRLQKELDRLRQNGQSAPGQIQEGVK